MAARLVRSSVSVRVRGIIEARGGKRSNNIISITDFHAGLIIEPSLSIVTYEGGGEGEGGGEREGEDVQLGPRRCNRFI